MEKTRITEKSFVLIADKFGAVFFRVFLTLNKFEGSFEQNALYKKINAAKIAAETFQGDCYAFQKVKKLENKIILKYISNSNKEYVFEFVYKSSDDLFPNIVFYWDKNSHLNDFFESL